MTESVLLTNGSCLAYRTDTKDIVSRECDEIGYFVCQYTPIGK